MSGHKNTAWKATMLRKFNGDEKALQAYMQNIGSKGGKLSVGGGFADGEAGRQRAIVAGAKGGSISRRKKRNDPTN